MELSVDTGLAMIMNNDSKIRVETNIIDFFEIDSSMFFSPFIAYFELILYHYLIFAEYIIND